MYKLNVAKKLIELRIAHGLTQAELACHLSVSNKTVSKWENGASLPDLPVLIKICKFYHVSSDLILGMTQETGQTLTDQFAPIIDGMSRKEIIQKVFELLEAIIPLIYDKLLSHDKLESITNAPKNRIQFPEECRSTLKTYDFFGLFTSYNQNNVAAFLLPNQSEFAWLKDPKVQKKLTRFFAFLSNQDALSMLYFIHSTACSESFTADYIAQNTNLEEERVAELLNEFCSVGLCYWVNAHLSRGTLRVYESRGDGLLLVCLSLAYDRMCNGKNGYKYNYDGYCKMIGGT